MLILGILLASDNSVASLHRLLNSYHGGLGCVCLLTA